jgi:hypothetical protein
MNKIITADYFPGQNCDCEARSSYECGCDADWTPTEVYKLREDAKQLADRLTALERERDEWKKAAFEIIEELERERNEARELAQQMSESNQVLQAEVRDYRKKEKLKP